tara:strand:+ start:2063 stop:3358 length:1296 start_codon:yes stop_codon:yes gene_type:complete
MQNLLFILILGVMFGQTNPETGWTFNISTQQAFVTLELLTIDDLIAQGDGSGALDASEECYGTGTCDVVGAFIDRGDGDGEICVGWQYAAPEFTTVVLSGNDNFTNFNGMQNGEIPYLKVWDATYGSILDISLSEGLSGWTNFGFSTLYGTSTAYNNNINNPGCTNPAACNYNPNALTNDDSCLFYDCLGECGGSAELDLCEICNGNSQSCQFGCESTGNYWGCDNICNGGILDECGICNGNGIPDGECYCEDHILDEGVYENDCYDYSIDLHEGANLIGFCGLPYTTNSITNLFSSNSESILSIIGEGYAATQLATNIWVGNLTEVDSLGGYWLLVNSNTSLMIDHAIPFSENNEYCLTEGVNLISPPCDTSRDDLTEDVVPYITGIITEGGAVSQIAPGVWAGSLNSLECSKGYWFITSTNFCFTFNCE